MVAVGRRDLVPYPGPELELPSLAALDSKREEGAPIQGIQVSTRRQEKGISIQRLQEKISHTNIFILAQ